jgi:hypothetical protein
MMNVDVIHVYAYGMNLITKRMHKEKILSSSCINQLTNEEMYCPKEKAMIICFLRKLIPFNKFEKEKLTYYNKWEPQIEVGRDRKEHCQTVENS